MNVSTGFPARAELDSGSSPLAITDSAGNLWRLTEKAPGVLHLMLSNTASGDTGVLVQPVTSNAVELRNRPLEWTV